MSTPSTPLPFPASQVGCWFRRIQRPLPWRVSYDPYQVAVSEFMLQQTQIDTALPYFNNWIATWPNWQSLAAANEDQVLAAWSGLGYYARARRLLALAKRITQDFDGKLPKEREILLTLDGVGPYTASALAGIAHNQPELALDGNVRRVLSRFYADERNSPSKPQDQFFLENLKPSLKKLKDRRAVVQGLMELGALLCRPANADCFNCPLKKQCLSALDGKWARRPLKKESQKAELRYMLYCWLKTKDGKLACLKRGSKGRYPNLYQPILVEHADLEEGKKELQSLLKLKELPESTKNFRRDFTRYKVLWYQFDLELKTSFALENYDWIPLCQIKNHNWMPVLKAHLPLTDVPYR